MKLRADMAFLGHQSKMNSVRLRDEGGVLRLTHSWRYLRVIVGGLFLMGPCLTTYLVYRATAEGLPRPSDKFLLFPGIPLALFLLLINVIFVHQLTRRRRLEFDLRSGNVLFYASDWGRPSSRTVPFAEVSSISVSGITRLADESYSASPGNRVPSYIVSMTLRDGSTVRLFETTNRTMIRSLLELLTCPSLAHATLQGEQVLGDDVTPKFSARKAIFG